MSVASPNSASPAPASGWPPAAPAALSERSKWLILAGLSTAAVMEVLDTSIVNVAIPQMSANFGATLDEIGWVSTGYILSNVIVLPLTSWLSSLFGRKRYLTGSIILFIIASMFCGFSHTLAQLVFWRVVQGAGGAALLSTAQATLFEVFPPRQQGMVQALFGLGIVVAPTFGPTVGGLITDNYSWPWIFFINLPIGIASAILAYFNVPDSLYARAKSKHVDWQGISLLAIGLGCLQMVLERGERDDWLQASWICWAITAAVITLSLFTWWELSSGNKDPVVDLRVLKHPSFAAAIPLALALGIGLYGGVFIFPVFVQTGLHFSAAQTGLVLLPGGLATAVSMIICGRIVRKVDPRHLIVLGFSLFICSMWQLSHMTLQSGIPDTYWPLIVRGFGLGFIFIPLTVATVQTLPKPQIAQGTALFTLARQLGGSFGIATLNTLIQHQIGLHRANLIRYTDPGNPILVNRLHGLAAHFHQAGFDATTATAMAYKAIDQALQGQAANLAFADAFRFLAMIFVVAGPLLLLLKRPPPIKAA